MRSTRLLIVASTLTALAWADRQPGSPLKPGFNLFKKQQDMQLGQEAAQQVLKQYPVVDNQFLQNYLKTIGQKLAAASEAQQSGFPFTFTVLNDASVNAFALPGGPMFVFTGLLKMVDTEAQLACVMGHEMSHVILRHSTNQVSKANLLQLPALLAGEATGSSLLGQLAQAGLGIGMLKFSRTDESQGDALGSHLMAEAGYNPVEMARFFEKIQALGSQGPQWLSDHPDPGNREKAIEAEVRTLPQRGYGYQTGQFDRMKAELRTVPAAPRQAAQRMPVAPAAPPSNTMREIRGQYFTVSYPDNWQAYGDSNSPSITIAPRDGLVQDLRGAQIGYGAILSYFHPEDERESLKDATGDLVHHLHAGNPTIEVTRTGRAVKAAGGDETGALLTVARPEGLFSNFNAMIQSIRFNR